MKNIIKKIICSLCLGMIMTGCSGVTDYRIILNNDYYIAKTSANNAKIFKIEDKDITGRAPSIPVDNKENDDSSNLSAYIDNELNDNINIQIRRNIVTKPKLRKKIEQLYSVRKLLTDSFNNQKNRLKNDFSKEIMKRINKKPQRKDNYSHCLFFICFVLSMVIISFLIIKSIL